MEDLADGFMMEHENELETNLQPKVDIRKNSARFLLQLREALAQKQLLVSYGLNILAVSKIGGSIKSRISHSS